VQKLIKKKVKKETDWTLIRRHEQSYVKLAKNYVLHKDASIENEFLESLRYSDINSEKKWDSQNRNEYNSETGLWKNH
jgi:hypothetical protein